MGKYAINDTTLTAIAEAIRAKTESSDPIDAADMAALIEGISAGGAAFNGNPLYCGIVVPTADAKTITITDEPDVIAAGFGDTDDPNIAMIFLMDDYSNESYETISIVQITGINPRGAGYIVATQTYVSSGSVSVNTDYTSYNISNKMRITVSSGVLETQSNYYYRAGKRYGWIAFKF